MHFKIETISALPTNISYRKLRLRADRKSGVPVRQPPTRCATPFTGLSWQGSLTWLSPCCSIFAPSAMSHTGARASAGHESQACHCGFLSLRALERSSRKFIGELLPGKNFPTSHPSTITQLLLERPSASLSYAFLKVSVISRHCNAYRVVIYTTRLWGGLQLSHICHRAGACC